MRKTFMSFIHLAAVLVLSFGVAHAATGNVMVGSTDHIVLGGTMLSDGWDASASTVSTGPVAGGSSHDAYIGIGGSNDRDAQTTASSARTQSGAATFYGSDNAIRWRMISDGGGGDCASCHNPKDKSHTAAATTIPDYTPADLLGRHRQFPQLE